MRHPLHPAFVHFPIACWSLATLADIASLVWGRPAWMLAGVLLEVGTLTAIAAMVTGLIEFVKIGEHNPALRVANRHMMMVMATWIAYATSLFLRLGKGAALLQPGTVAIALSIVGFLLLCSAGWLGAKLVYGHGVGVTKA